MGMRATVSRDMVLKDVFVPDEGDVLPPGLFGAMYNAFPHLSPLTFSATFLGIMQASYDYTVTYLTGQIPGAPGLQTEAATKGQAVAEMLFTLEAARALYYRAIAEARVDAPVAAVQRARAAHVTVQRSVVTLTQEAIRVCGGRALLKRYPLERFARDARAGAVMRPWTQDIATQQAWEVALGVGGAAGRGIPRPSAKATARPDGLAGRGTSVKNHPPRRMPMPGRLADKVALITGGASGIGRACAVRFAQEGARVCVADRDLAAATDAARKIDGDSRRAIAVAVDTTDEAANDAMVRRCVEALGGVDILVAAAGIGSPRPDPGSARPHTVLSIPTERLPDRAGRQSLGRAPLQPRGGALDGGAIVAAAASSISPPSCRACRRPAPPTA